MYGWQAESTKECLMIPVRGVTLALLLSILLAWSALPSFAAHAQGDNPCDRVGEDGSIIFDIAFGDSVRRRIDSENYLYGYCFEGRQGDRVRISMTTTSGNLDTLLVLADTVAEQIIAENNNSGSSGSERSTDSALELLLPADSLYLIIASRAGAEDGSTAGRFVLSLELLAGPSTYPGITLDEAAALCAALPTRNSVIGYGAAVTGEVLHSAYMQVYCFGGRAGDEVLISMTVTGGNLESLLMLTGEGFLEDVLAVNSDGARNRGSARIAFTLPADGAYLILSSRLNLMNGTTTGSYSLTLSITAGPSTAVPSITVPPVGSPDPGIEPTPLAVPVDLRLTCPSMGQTIIGQPGTSLVVQCPANCAGGRLWGTDVYTDSSTICTAAAHAGVITLAEGGIFRLTLLDGQTGYRGSTRNGIDSNSWNTWGRSFIVAALEN